MPTYYLHVRAREGAVAFATVGPYRSLEDAEAAAEFAKLPHWIVVEVAADPTLNMRLF